MTKTKLHLTIPNPCEQDWDAMKLQSAGRFCEACNKCVIDFTTKTDREVIEIVSGNKAKICGRFREDQLNRNLILPQQARISGWRLFALTFGVLFTTDFAFAQTSKPKQTTTKHYSSAKPVQHKGKYLVIRGTVKNKTGEPLQETFIGLKNKLGILAFTDSLGNFRFRIPESWITNSKHKKIVLTFSRAGYHKSEKSVLTPKNHTFAITLNALPEEFKKQEAVAEVTYERPLIGPEKAPSMLVQGEMLRIPFREINYSKDSFYKMKHDLKD